MCSSSSINLGVEWLLPSPALRESSVTVECSPSVPPNMAVASWTWLWTTWKVVSATEALSSHVIYLHLNSHVWVVATGLCWPVKELPYSLWDSGKQANSDSTPSTTTTLSSTAAWGDLPDNREIKCKENSRKGGARCQLHRASGRENKEPDQKLSLLSTWPYSAQESS